MFKLLFLEHMHSNLAPFRGVFAASGVNCDCFHSLLSPVFAVKVLLTSWMWQGDIAMMGDWPWWKHGESWVKAVLTLPCYFYRFSGEIGGKNNSIYFYPSSYFLSLLSPWKDAKGERIENFFCWKGAENSVTVFNAAFFRGVSLCDFDGENIETARAAVM